MPDAHETHAHTHAAQAGAGSAPPCQCDQQLGYALPLLLVALAVVMALDRWSSWRKKKRTRADNLIDSRMRD